MLDVERRFEFTAFSDKESFITLHKHFELAFSLLADIYQFRYIDVINIQLTFTEILFDTKKFNTLQGIDDLLPDNMKNDIYKNSAIFDNTISEDVKPL